MKKYLMEDVGVPRIVLWMLKLQVILVILNFILKELV